MNSTDRLPNPSDLIQRAKALAALDAILCPQWDLRYFSFNKRWGQNEEMGSFRNGEDDDYFILFAAFGVGIKGHYKSPPLLANDDRLNYIKKNMPERFLPFIDEPAFSVQEASFILWFNDAITKWIEIGLTETASEPHLVRKSYLLSWLYEDEAYFCSWVKNYYDRTIEVEIVKKIFSGIPINIADVTELNETVDLRTVVEDLEEIGYPHSLKLV